MTDTAALCRSPTSPVLIQPASGQNRPLFITISVGSISSPHGPHSDGQNKVNEACYLLPETNEQETVGL